MDKDAKYDYSVFQRWLGLLFFSSDSSISLLHHIAACTILRSGVSQAQAFHNLLQQLSVKLWSYNAKILLCYIHLLSLEEISNSPGLNMNSILCCVVNVESLVDAQDSRSPLSLYISCSVFTSDVSFEVPICNITL